VSSSLSAPTDMYWNQRVTPAALFGLSPGGPGGGAGKALPPSSSTGADQASVPWHPDSPLFWLGAVVALTVLGVTGASVHVRAFKARAGAELGSE
jgi:hypothetical protein